MSGGDDRITVSDFLRALLLLDEDQSPSAGSPSVPARAGVPISPPDLSGETLLSFTRYSLPPLPFSLRRLLTLVIGSLSALVVGAIASQLVRGDSPGLGWLLLVVAGGVWASVLLFEEWPSDHLLRFGPVISGPASATSFHSRPAYDTTARLVLAVCAIAMMAVAFVFSSGNAFTIPGVLGWIASTLLWLLVFAEKPLSQVIQQACALPARLSTLSLPRLAPLLAGLLLLGIAAFMRFYLLDSIPPEMTSDHVEKLLDAYRVSQGARDIFFTNNGGREAIQFYLVALASRLTGGQFTFLTLKIVSAVEALALIPVIFFWGREAVDRETGLWTAILVAVSWWHLMLGHLGLRIVLTPLFITLILITLLRGLRTGARRDWLWAGLWMGVGVYAYQALRISPLLALAACLVAIIPPAFRSLLARTSDPAESARQAIIFTATLQRQGSNLLAAGVIAITLFIPMLRVWADYPGELWNRVINRTTSSEVAITEPVFSVFADNYGRALRMFHQVGDSAWINAPPATPALERLTAVLLVMGLAGWVIRLVRRRDPGDFFILLAGLILLLPSALAVAFPIENPSFTRASGVIPVVFLFSGTALSLLRQLFDRAISGRVGLVISAILPLLLVGLITAESLQVLTVRYPQSYRAAALNPSEVAEAVLTYIDEDELAGVHLVGWPYWHDDRAIALEMGDPTLNTAIFDSDALALMLESSASSFPERPLVFIIHTSDDVSRALLIEAFPSGVFRTSLSDIPSHAFTLFIVE